MKRLYIICSLFFMLTILACKKNISTPQPEPLKNLSLDSLKTLTTDLSKARYTDLTFTSPTTGYAIAEGIIAKTINGGLNWTTYNLVEKTQLRKVQFTSNQVGYIIGSEGDKGVLLKTTNAGQNWNKIDFEQTAVINGVFFINDNVGFLVGNNIFIKTINGGASWTSFKTSDSNIFNDVNFKNNLEGIATANNGVYFKTIDGGINWIKGEISKGNNLGKIYYLENKEFVTKSSDSLVNIKAPFDVLTKPSNAYKLLFLNAQQVIGIGNHYEEGFWPLGDIMISNNGSTTYNQKTYTPVNSIDFQGIAKMGDHKIMIIGGGFEGPILITLSL